MRFIKPRRPVTRIFIHCSASDNPEHDNVATMDRWHKQRGWSGVGYHFFDRKDGTIEIGRDIEKTPAAQGGNNRGTIAICLHGLAKSKFTEAQFDALRDLCHQINEAYQGNISFHGHCEVSPKSCPVFDYKKVLGLSLTGMMTDNSGWKKRDEENEDILTADEFHAGRPNPGSITLRLGDKGMAVELLQRRLDKLGYHVGSIDGHFGKRTRSSTLAFQADNHLVTDGVVGRATYEAFTDAEAREIGDKRSKAHIVALANDGSRIADASVKGMGTGVAVSSFGLAGFVGQFSESFQSIKEQIEPVAQPFGGLTTIMLVGLLLIVGFMTWQFIRTSGARVEDHQTGKTS